MENFERENIDELLKICQIYQYFSCQNFAPSVANYVSFQVLSINYSLTAGWYLTWITDITAANPGKYCLKLLKNLSISLVIS